MDKERAIEVLCDTIDAFFEEVDPDNFETEDLAHTLLRELERAKLIT
ncbi:MAG: hypothetical protein HOY79_33740 [Streptomyces sp.]|nr:hypothetical protein [Streptomyces sp.]NUS11344.1 hypothetical protein [Streptomyces sp.]NUS23380.1 hypothetical protein [Streptomyces sp.]